MNVRGPIMTDFTGHTNNDLATDIAAAVAEAERRAANEPLTPENTTHLTAVRSRLAKAHLQLALALESANGGGFTTLTGGIPKEP